MIESQASAERPILIVPYVWIGDFVRCHSVVRVLRAANPNRAVDMFSSTLCAPLADYMPGVRKAIVADLPRRRLGLGLQRKLAAELRREGYGQALILSRKWKAALARWWAGIPLRTGFFGEARIGVLNDIRPGERSLPRMIDQMGALALPKGARLPSDWPLPRLVVPRSDVEIWKHRHARDNESGPVVALCPGAVGAGKAWPSASYGELAAKLTGAGALVWVIGGPNEKDVAHEIEAAGGPGVRDLTGTDLRDAIIALAAADAVVSNDSGLMHVAAAIGTPTVAIFGPTSPWHWKPLNPIAAILEPEHEPKARLRAREKGNKAVAHHRTADVSADRVNAAVGEVLARAVR
jgi:heptosyltransferase II